MFVRNLATAIHCSRSPRKKPNASVAFKKLLHGFREVLSWDKTAYQDLRPL